MCTSGVRFLREGYVLTCVRFLTGVRFLREESVLRGVGFFRDGCVLTGV